jgi:hypothetical protein
MIVHAFLFQWKPQATGRDKQQAAERIRALQGQIPGIIEASYHANASPRSQGFTHGGVMKFRDQAALTAYFTHPVHQQLVDWLMPLLAVAAELDYEL